MTMTPCSSFGLTTKLLSRKSGAGFIRECTEVVSQRYSYGLHQPESFVCVHAKLGKSMPVTQ